MGYSTRTDGAVAALVAGATVAYDPNSQDNGLGAFFIMMCAIGSALVGGALLYKYNKDHAFTCVRPPPTLRRREVPELLGRSFSAKPVAASRAPPRVQRPLWAWFINQSQHK